MLLHTVTELSEQEGGLYRRGLIHTAVIIHAVGNRSRKRKGKIRKTEYVNKKQLLRGDMCARRSAHKARKTGNDLQQRTASAIASGLDNGCCIT